MNKSNIFFLIIGIVLGRILIELSKSIPLPISNQLKCLILLSITLIVYVVFSVLTKSRDKLNEKK